MSELFPNDDSDSELNINVNNEYAKNYNNWRRKEELNKLKTKYGENAEDYLDDESSSSSDDDEEEQLEKIKSLDRDFYKTLSSLKNKDPKIYDQNTTFFNEPIDLLPKTKSKKAEPTYIKDYERKMLLEKGATMSESEDEAPRSYSPTYVEEQELLKENVKKVLANEEASEDWMKLREKTKEEAEKDETEYAHWLLGQVNTLKDSNDEADLKPLKDYWNNPKLDKGEQFLRDYVLNERFLEKDNGDYIPTYEEVVHDSDNGISEDEEQVHKQEEFEYKYNYRFEEPDQDFIKRYPRTMEQSLRKSDDRRKLKRVEVKERKEREKKEKFEELKQLEKMKKIEMQEKLEKLREVVGTSYGNLDNLNLDDDFDPDAHDKCLNSIFNNDFYEGEENDQKPEFPDIDAELELEKWDKYDQLGTCSTEKTTHCEDEDFNMDCDYDPTVEQKEDTLGGKKKRKRKSKFAQVVSQPKPVFDSKETSYDDYLSQYYKLERVIDDSKLRWREVIPNNFGLTDEEILMANEKELNRWYSIKKTFQIRPDHVEKYDQIAYHKKAQNEALKRKLLPSLYTHEKPIEVVNEKVEHKEKSTEKNVVEVESKKLKKKKKAKTDKIEEKVTEDTPVKEVKIKKKKNKSKPEVIVENEIMDKKTDKAETSVATDKAEMSTDEKKVKKIKKKKNGIQNKNVEHGKGKKRKRPTTEENGMEISDARLQAFGIKPKKFRNKLKYGKH